MDMYELGKEIQHRENDQLTVEGKENSDCAFVKGKRSTVGHSRGFESIQEGLRANRS